MRIITLSAEITELVWLSGAGSQIVGCCHQSDYPEEVGEIPVVTELGSAAGVWGKLCHQRVLESKLVELAPDLIIAPGMVEDSQVPAEILDQVEAICGKRVKIRFYAPSTLEQVFEGMQRVTMGLAEEKTGQSQGSKLKAQIMDWSDNFYERMKNKRVVFLSAIDPLKLAGFWIPEMIKLASAQSMAVADGKGHRTVSWEEVQKYRPDVIIVAPEGFSLDRSMKSFLQLEKFPNWEELPAVKRGEVIFAAGDGLFYRATPRLRASMGILISAIAGLESGYITDRDSFYRLRWLEMQRHRLVE